MLDHGVDVYVGDHPADMAAARSTVVNDRPVTAVGVTSDGFNARDLIAAGADVVLRDLTEFPDWLAAATRLDGRLASVADSPSAEPIRATALCPLRARGRRRMRDNHFRCMRCDDGGARRFSRISVGSAWAPG